MGAHQTKAHPAVPEGPVVETPAATVGGWTLVFFAFIPLMMAANGDGAGYGIAGAVLLLAAAVLIAIGRRKAKKVASSVP
jgi:hypothetical protein